MQAKSPPQYKGTAEVIPAYFEDLESMTALGLNQGFLIKIKHETVKFTLPYHY